MSAIFPAREFFGVDADAGTAAGAADVPGGVAAGWAGECGGAFGGRVFPAASLAACCKFFRFAMSRTVQLLGNETI